MPRCTPTGLSHAADPQSVRTRGSARLSVDGSASRSPWRWLGETSKVALLVSLDRGDVPPKSVYGRDRLGPVERPLRLLAVGRSGIQVVLPGTS